MSVLLFDSTSRFHKIWAAQWEKEDPLNRKPLPIDGSGSHEHIRDMIVDAAKLAGKTAFNELILAVGHGGAAELPTEGLVDLAPKSRMRLAKAAIGSRNEKGTEIFFNPFYDFVFPGPGRLKSDKTNDEESVRLNDPINIKGAKFRLSRHAIYQSIGSAIQDSHVNQIVFLTCNVGNAIDFIKKIALDWQVKVKAYTRFTIFQLNSQGTARARVFFEGDKDGTGSNTAAAEINIPQNTFITVGPPPSPSHPQPSVLPPAKTENIWPGSGLFRVAGLLGTDPPHGGRVQPSSPAARMSDPRKSA
jgi:hypothetical protein